ncbi:hypothetical protein LT493_16310 [Streptomyces tricolor]|nr:hypothetical protein [Streptomyces tricolor]
MPPGVTEETVRHRAGLPAPSGRDRRRGRRPRRGNITSIPVLDVLYELYAHNRVVALETQPGHRRPLRRLHPRPGPADRPRRGPILTGGADVGTYLVHHPRSATST